MTIDRRLGLLSLLVLCSASSAFAQEDAPPELPPAVILPATKPPELAPPPASDLPALPDLPTMLDAPSLKASRPDGKKLVGLAWSTYSAAPGELNELEQVLRGLLEARAAVESLPPALFPCESNNTKCIVALAGSRDVDVILFGTISKVENGYSASIRAIDPAAARIIAQTDQNLDSTEPAHVRAWAEAIACRLKLQSKCTSNFRISADLREFRLFLDNEEQPRPYQLKGEPKEFTTAVGVHDARVMFGQNTSLVHKLPVATAFETPVTLYARRLDKGGLILQGEGEFSKEMDGSVKVPISALPGPDEGKTRKYLSYALGGAGLVAVGVGAFEGIKSKSQANDVNTHINAQGGVALPRDVADINSYHQKASTANILYGVGAVLLVGAVVLNLVNFNF